MEKFNKEGEVVDMENFINRTADWIKFFLYSFIWLVPVFVFLLAAYAQGLVSILEGELLLGLLSLAWWLSLAAVWFSSGVDDFMEALNKAKGQWS